MPCCLALQRTPAHGNLPVLCRRICVEARTRIRPLLAWAVVPDSYSSRRALRARSDRSSSGNYGVQEGGFESHDGQEERQEAAVWKEEGGRRCECVRCRCRRPTPSPLRSPSPRLPQASASESHLPHRRGRLLPARAAPMANDIASRPPSRPASPVTHRSPDQKGTWESSNR